MNYKNAIRDGGSTALWTAYTVDHVDMVYTIDMTYTVDTVYTADNVYTVYTIETALNCF